MANEFRTADSSPDNNKDTDEREFLALAHRRFRLSEEAEATIRRDALDDLEFRIGKQWPSDIQTSRTNDARPCLTMNRLPQFIRTVTNEQRQQRPSVVVNPVGSGADIDTAAVCSGIIRHIELQSDSEIAYDSAFEAMVTSGFGYWRIITQYIDEESFDQEILIKRIRNAFAVYFDPDALEPDYSDARYCFVIEDMPHSEYRLKYPNSFLASLTQFEGLGNQPAGWMSRETIRVAEYIHVDEEAETLYRFTDGTTSGKKEEGREVAETRKVIKRKVISSKINALEVIEEQEWPGRWIPIVPVLGDDLDVSGRRHLSGMVRNAKDPQRQYNYMASAATEAIALAPKAPFVGAEGQFENHEQQWAQANVRNFAYLEYKPQSLAGQPMPPPQRMAVEPPIQAMMLMVRQADQDLKSTTGIYDPTLGQPGPEQSGRAILARQHQGAIATLNYSDNLGRAIRFTGRQLLDLIPKVYDAPRLQRIVDPDGSIRHIGVFNSVSSGLNQQAAMQMIAQAGPEAPEMAAIRKVYDVGTGRYDVSLSVGPGYQSKRQEAVQSMMTLIQAYPNIMAFVGDLLVKNMDWPGAQEIAQRLRKMLPPQLQEMGGDMASQLAASQSQLQTLSQQHEQLVGALNNANQIIATRQVEAKNKYDIALLQEQTKIVVAELNARVDTAKARADQELQQLEMMHDAAHERAMAAQQQGQQGPPQPPPQPANGGAPPAPGMQQ
jgi:hypothetical protein